MRLTKGSIVYRIQRCSIDRKVPACRGLGIRGLLGEGSRQTEGNRHRGRIDL
jgi:hypothetical protein